MSRSARGPRIARRLPAVRFAKAPTDIRRAVLDALDAQLPGRGLRVFVKTATLFALLFATYAALYSGELSGWALATTIAFAQPLMLVSAVGVAHDASHDALSKRAWVNRLAVWLFDVLGINGYIWHFDHVTAHHSAPNVSAYDANLYGWGPIRMDPRAPRRSWHRFQHLYAWLIYALASLFKVYLGDFLAFRRSRVEAYLPTEHSRAQWARLFALKAWAIAVALVAPLAINGQPAWLLGGYVLGHAVTGLLMGAIFQPTHTNTLVDWPQPDDDGRLEDSFAAHVLRTAADFSIGQPFVTWIAGGLNIHAVHHLLPRLPHHVLPEAAQILERLASSHGLRYHTFDTWDAALLSHYRALRQLGAGQPVGLDSGLRGRGRDAERRFDGARRAAADGQSLA